MGKQAKERTERRRRHEKQQREARRMADRRLFDALAALGDPLSVVHALTSSPMGLHRHLTLSRAVQVALRAAAPGRPVGASDGGLSEVLDESIWASTELPILVDNSNVNDVIFHLLGR